MHPHPPGRITLGLLITVCANLNGSPTRTVNFLYPGQEPPKRAFCTLYIYLRTMEQSQRICLEEVTVYSLGVPAPVPSPMGAILKDKNGSYRREPWTRRQPARKD